MKNKLIYYLNLTKIIVKYCHLHCFPYSQNIPLIAILSNKIPAFRLIYLNTYRFVDKYCSNVIIFSDVLKIYKSLILSLLNIANLLAFLIKSYLKKWSLLFLAPTTAREHICECFYRKDNQLLIVYFLLLHFTTGKIYAERTNPRC